MDVAFGRMTLLVEDYDEAIAYYTETFPFEVLADVEVGEGHRTVHVGNPGQEPVGLWLMEPTSEDERALVGAQTGPQPGFVFYTDDLAGTHETLRERGVEFTSEPTTDESGTYVHFEDLYGNHGVLVERID